MNCKTYSFKKVTKGPEPLDNILFWQDINQLNIENYFLMNNGYEPKVFVKGCYSDEFIYLFFNVMEHKVTIKYLKTGDPVFKDSCVEFFLNLFPDEREQYFNIELNALGTIKFGFGIKRNRIYLNDDELKEMQVFSTIKTPMVGNHGKSSWQLYYSIPFSVFEKHYGKKFTGTDAIGNFYKCGDETEFPHYGMWNFIESPKPDFHLPEYFGKMIFEK